MLLEQAFPDGSQLPKRDVWDSTVPSLFNERVYCA
jgi:hypothetical protein